MSNNFTPREDHVESGSATPRPNPSAAGEFVQRGGDENLLSSPTLHLSLSLLRLPSCTQGTKKLNKKFKKNTVYSNFEP